MHLKLELYGGWLYNNWFCLELIPTQGTFCQIQRVRVILLNVTFCLGMIELVSGLERSIFFHILGILIPIDFHIFQRGRYTTNQLKFARTWEIQGIAHRTSVHQVADALQW